MIRFTSNSGGGQGPSDVVPPGPYLCYVQRTQLGKTKKGFQQLVLSLIVGTDKAKVTLWIPFHRPAQGTDIAVGRDQIRALAKSVEVGTDGEWNEKSLEKRVCGVWLDYEGPRGTFGPRNVLPAENAFYPAVQEQGGKWRLPNPLPESPLDPDTDAMGEDPGFDGPPADYDEDLPF